MTGVIAHEEAQRLRSALQDVLTTGGDPSETTDAARTALFRVVEVLESSGGAVVLPLGAFMSTQQAAESIGVSRMTVVRLIDRGELVAEGGGVHRRIAATEVDRYRVASATRRRAALRALAGEITDDTGPDQVISTR